ncbi:Glycosyl transferases group 1 [compost metagenome]|uniref:glycosyltransferase n=1 Tax=Pseudomonas vranovensis TaxID=321661 RepID=UPI0003F917CE|nr:glycosyltransferase [Pseudomonas vranovensis]
MRVLFLGGIFSDSDKNNIVQKSKGGMQHAADTLQKNYIQGFSQSPSVDSLTVINLPFIGAYPRRYSDIFYQPAAKRETLDRVTIMNVSFFNLTIVKNLHKVVRAVKAILLQMKADKGKPQVLVCYSMHLPFLLACYVVKSLRSDTHFCVIVPDLPEYMAVRRGLAKFAYNMLSRISYFIVNRADSISAITKDMLGEFDDGIKKVVIEGIADKRYIALTDAVERKKYFLYTGTLDRRYGIRNLVDSYVASGVSDYELFICGDGDDRKYVEQIAAVQSGVRYFGQLDRESVLKLQRNAALLVNPRDNDSVYTKYSFPSKIIEYMSSGVPVLMYTLDGIPEEYYDFCYLVPPGSDGLKMKLLELSKLADSEFVSKGALAKQFIVENKMPDMQVAKLLDAIKGKCHV